MRVPLPLTAYNVAANHVGTPIAILELGNVGGID
jgi:hypothetical protein